VRTTRCARWLVALSVPVCLVTVGCGRIDAADDRVTAASVAVPRVWLFPATGSGEQAGLGGTLAYDAAADCLLMEESGEAIVWPEGTVGTADGPGVVLPDGSIARVGDRLSGGGGHHPGTVASAYGIAPECVTDSLMVFQFDEIKVNEDSPDPNVSSTTEPPSASGP